MLMHHKHLIRETLVSLSETTAAASIVRTVDGREVPAPGSYVVDGSHANVEFIARHLMISKVRGRFTSFTATIEVGDDPLQSRVTAEIDASSIRTGDAGRDEHLRSADFLDAANHPTLSFESTSVAAHGSTWAVTGDLTIKGVTRPVELRVTLEGAGVDPWGNSRIGVAASGEIDREAWGLTWNQTLETGGVLVGKKITIELAAEAVRTA